MTGHDPSVVAFHAPVLVSCLAVPAGDWTRCCRGRYLTADVTLPEEVRPMNAVTLWVLPLAVTVGD